MRRVLGQAGGLWIAATILAGCTGPVTALSPQSASPFPKEEVTKKALLYVAVNTGAGSAVNVFTYPRIHYIASLPSDESFSRVCSDPKTGHVFVSQTAGLDEYERGATTKLKTLVAPDGYESLQGCSVDPLSGDVAVVAYDGSKGGGLLLYHHARGTPRIYSDPSIHAYYYCTYDDSGNVFVLGYGVTTKYITEVLTELPKGQTKLQDLTLSAFIGYPQKLQWDGKYLALNLAGTIFQVAVSGSNAKIVGSTQMFGDRQFAGGMAWIAGDTVLAPHGNDFARRLGVWPYPGGGEPTRVTPHVTAKNEPFSDINLSEPPPH